MIKTSPQSLLQALHWIMATPPLFTDSASPFMVHSSVPDGFSMPDSEHPSLRKLSDSINQKQRLRLGIYYETLWHCLLELHPECAMLAHNLPVRVRQDNATITLGEFDLIYQHQNQIFHRELAVKFYLGLPDSDKTSSSSPHNHWVGPGLKDRLDRKMQRTLNHQINLGDMSEGQQVLKDQGIHSINKEVCIQGRLFYPLKGHCAPPINSHPEHPRGIWMTLSQFNDWYQDNTIHQEKHVQQFLIPEKLQWIGFIPPKTWLSANELLAELGSLQTPQLIYTTKHCLFLVPDQWPEDAHRII